MTPGLLAGKLAIVTGAGSGIGRAVCKLFASEGAKVIAADQNVKAAEDTVATLEGSEHLAVEIDVKSAASIENAFTHAKERFLKPPTIVVNSAGILRENVLLKLSEDDFDAVINVNLKGTFLVTQRAVKAMIGSGVAEGGSVINVGSISGKTGIKRHSNSASKAGVEAFTKTAAIEFGKYGIRVNAVLPAFIETAMTDYYPENVKQAFIERIALGRLGQPMEVAELILFLASVKSSYVNGASIEITGGLQLI